MQSIKLEAGSLDSLVCLPLIPSLPQAPLKSPLSNLVCVSSLLFLVVLPCCFTYFWNFIWNHLLIFIQLYVPEIDTCYFMKYSLFSLCTDTSHVNQLEHLDILLLKIVWWTCLHVSYCICEKYIHRVDGL